ncbi:hypothetical protein NN3_18390 [Nocardia neocaledoniensis NBRC 108232]|uniref:DUF7691 domain-containing protein n=1 Tax=Nocardia neocaledoniensis TaxID=236511 RepID=A0A317N639_9NOCA|nr:hypothetical protein [Nocardia neocaledoniensis]PWV70439.1 hypothetical protein DFR69_113153 [Nocardia neocaledoniensis]GEM30832.1 hypothetical protein NN3_18390 [Nocardia neocaledoniensis NBRC 108232]
MSYGLEIYLLDVAATRALVGSRDDHFLESIRTKHGDQLRRDDDYFSDEIEEGAPTAYAALHAVIHGGPFSTGRSHTFQYGYAYKRLCSVTGSFLDNDRFSPFRGDWLSEVDKGMRELGITAVSVDSFLGADGFPASLPIGFPPSCGEWTPDQIAEALEQFEVAERAIAQGKDAPPVDSEVRRGVMQCVSWLRSAQAQPGFGLIGFCA